MRKYYLIAIILFLFCLKARAQSVNDFVIIYLTNEYVVKGQLVEMREDNSILIKLNSGDLIDFKSTELIKIEVDIEKTRNFRKKERIKEEEPPLSSHNYSRQSAYVNINAGYSFSMNSQNFGQVLSQGKGLNFGGSFGYNFNRYIGVELGFSYLIGGRYKEKIYDYFSEDLSNNVYRSKSHKINNTLSSNILIINPSLVISPGLARVNPYARLGLVIGTGSVIEDYEGTVSEVFVNYTTGYEQYYTDIYNDKLKFKGGISIGLNAAIGAVFTLKDNMSLFSEINIINMLYVPAKVELIKATENGVDLLPYMTTDEIEMNVYNEFFPFRSVGLNFGIRISF
jgi:hypothetical protein